jgi:hypothetical protein
MCRDLLLDAGSPKVQKQSKGKKQTNTAPELQKVLALLERLCADNQVVHPKQEKVKSIALEHFTSPSENLDVFSDSKMIVFATFRDYVEEIVEHLNQEDPIIRATAFVGQGSSKKGQKGMTQKEQLAVSDSNSVFSTPSSNTRCWNNLNEVASMFLWPRLLVRKAWTSARLIQLSFMIHPKILSAR